MGLSNVMISSYSRMGMSGRSISWSIAEAEDEDAAAAAFFPFFIGATQIEGTVTTTTLVAAAAVVAARADGVVALPCGLIETTARWMCSVTRCWPCS